MVTKRLIPCLDVHAGRVVKGTHFADLRDAGDPVELADRYNQLGADELVFLDIGATHESRDITLQLIKAVAKRVFIPFTVGGGIQSIDTIGALLDHGADKVSLNSVVVKQPALVEAASRKFGAQCVVVAIDAQPVSLDASQPSGVDPSVALDDQSVYEVVINGGRVRTGIDVVKWAERVVLYGAGELLVTAMHCDGAKQGYDLSLMRSLSSLSVPVIASGGAGALSHVVEVLQVSDAALLASVLHFGTFTVSEVRQSCVAAGLPMRGVLS